MKKSILRIVLMAISLILPLSLSAQESISLEGMWRFELDPMGFGKTPGSELYLATLTDDIYLPGSMDQAGKGIQNSVKHVDRLSRKFEYSGQAWYQREVVIPESWQGKEVILNLERCHWETTLYIDGQFCASDERLSTPNRFVITDWVKAGSKHTITLCVDNRLKYPMDHWNHGTTEHTQTNWNGIVGDIELVAKSPIYITRLNIYPNIDNKSVEVKLELNKSEVANSGSELELSLTNKAGEILAKESVELQSGDTLIRHTFVLNGNIELWDEFNPYLYSITARLTNQNEVDTRTENFGMRKVEQGKHHIRLNDRDIHLRGVLDCAVFPLTGYPSTETEQWKKIFETVKDYGFNHVRFHSWTPPKAAFEAADQVGIYLQTELPMWIKDVGLYPERQKFFEKEMYAILEEYGNHPSFLLYCNGNENEGDFDKLEDLICKGKEYDPRHLYSASTARTHVEADQYFVSHVTTKGWITVYEGSPNTNWDRNECSDIDVPVIAHETGQRCMYPNFDEIAKYSGVLEARNFVKYRESLSRNNMLHQADDFLRATGAHTVLQYKEVNEALLRTTKSGGYQLLGLADFPGQGSAFVGILDAFWESKGLVTAEKYRESNGATVILARFEKRIFVPQENFVASMSLYNYGESEIKKGALEWSLVDKSDHVIESGKLKHNTIERAVVDSLGIINVPLSKISTTGKYTIKATIDGKRIANEWDIWVYPTDGVQEEADKDFKYTREWSEAREMLTRGESVLFIPDSVAGRKTHFASHFWNPIMFNWDPMIVGTLIDHKNGAFDNFTTENYADWQWWDILSHATAIDLTDFRDLTPVIQSVDSYELNRKLAVAFEVSVGNGKLFVLTVDPNKEIGSRAATRQLIKSVKEYVSSEKFAPRTEVSAYQLDAVFDKRKVGDKGLENPSQSMLQLLNK